MLFWALLCCDARRSRIQHATLLCLFHLNFILQSSSGADGKQLVVLPPKTETTLMLDFSPQEREFYDALHARSKTSFQGLSNEGANQYIRILTLLLRLRQCCDHPYLVLGFSRTSRKAKLSKLLKSFVKRFTTRASRDEDNTLSPEVVLTLLSSELWCHLPSCLLSTCRKLPMRS